MTILHFIVFDVGSLGRWKTNYELNFMMISRPLAVIIKNYYFFYDFLLLFSIFSPAETHVLTFRKMGLIKVKQNRIS